MERGNTVTIADLPIKEAPDVPATSVCASCTTFLKWCSRAYLPDATPIVSVEQMDSFCRVH
jgi:hypothetical protein